VRPGVRIALLAAGLAFMLFVANLVATSVDDGPEAAARTVVARAAPAGARIELLRSRYTGRFGINRLATVDFVVTGPSAADTVRVVGRKANGFAPWRMDGATASR
jgi:hypothetical protein